MQISLDDRFLEDVGLGAMPRHEKEPFLEHIRSELEWRVGGVLIDGLSEEQMREFEAFIDRSETVVREWIAVHAEDYAQDRAFQDLTAGAAPEASELEIMSEYAAQKWLQINRPDYPEIIERELAAMREEISANAKVLLAPHE